MRTTCLSWFLLLNVYLVQACHLSFTEGTNLPEETGHAFLARCAESLHWATEAAGVGRKLPETREMQNCLVTTSALLDTVLRSPPRRCQMCPEGCVVVLLLQALAFPADFDDVTSCSFSLMYYFRAKQLFEDFEPHWTQMLLENLPALVNARRGQCAAARRRELEDIRLPPAALDKEDVPLPPAEAPDKEAVMVTVSPTSSQVAVLLAATSSMLQRYQPFINLWRCYALSHGLAFILETDPGKAPVANWMRWFAAERFLLFYQALLIVDPDQVIVAPCWHLSIPELLGTWPEDGRPPPDVGLRDFGRPQTLNNGVALLRNSPRGWHFLRLLLQKAVSNESYDSECVQYLFPNFNGNHDLARYAMCWWRQSEALAGPFGQRDSQVIRFLDPRRYDVNHVVGARGLTDPALLYHFAGRSKDWDAMLKTFGLDREGTSDCRAVLRYVRQRRAAVASVAPLNHRAGSAEQCVPGGPVVEECEPPEIVC